MMFDASDLHLLPGSYRGFSGNQGESWEIAGIQFYTAKPAFIVSASMSLGKTLESLLADLGLNGADVARGITVDRKTVYNWLHRNDFPDSPELPALADWLQIPWTVFRDAAQGKNEIDAKYKDRARWKALNQQREDAQRVIVVRADSISPTVPAGGMSEVGTRRYAEELAGNLSADELVMLAEELTRQATKKIAEASKGNKKRR